MDLRALIAAMRPGRVVRVAHNGRGRTPAPRAESGRSDRDRLSAITNRKSTIYRKRYL